MPVFSSKTSLEWQCRVIGSARHKRVFIVRAPNSSNLLPFESELLFSLVFRSVRNSLKYYLLLPVRFVTEHAKPVIRFSARVQWFFGAPLNAFKNVSDQLKRC